MQLLAESNTGPVHRGRWTVGPAAGPPAKSLVPVDGMDPVRIDFGEQLEPPDKANLAWGMGGSDAALVALRPLSDPDCARVKAYRKLVGDRSLPPVLLWFVGGLAASVIIDGHDRLVAAMSEGYAPLMLDVARVLTVEQARERDEWSDLDEIDRYKRVLRAQPEHWEAHKWLVRRIASTSAHMEEVYSTMAWPSADSWEDSPLG